TEGGWRYAGAFASRAPHPVRAMPRERGSQPRRFARIVGFLNDHPLYRLAAVVSTIACLPGGVLATKAVLFKQSQPSQAPPRQPDGSEPIVDVDRPCRQGGGPGWLAAADDAVLASVSGRGRHPARRRPVCLGRPSRRLGTARLT